MNKIYKLLTIFLLVFICNISYSQNENREVIKTPRNGHSIYRSKGPNDKVMKSYIDDEKKPFSGKFIEKGWNGELISEQNFVDGILEGDYIEYDTRGDKTYISVQGKYKNGTKIGEHISWWRPNHKKEFHFMTKMENYTEK